MSTTELKDFIDGRTMEERQWMAVYLLDELRALPELKLDAQELSELARRTADLEGGCNRVTQTEAEARWAAQEKEGE